VQAGRQIDKYRERGRRRMGEGDKERDPLRRRERKQERERAICT